MILGRSTNLWTAAITAILNVVFLVAAAAGNPVPGDLIAALNLAATAIIVLIAAQPPVLKPGDPYVVTTPNGDVNVTKQANTNVTAVPPTEGNV
jgi:hypothetical protein